MHILKIIHGYPPHYNAGSEVYSQSICDELSKQHRVSVFTREENPYLPDFHLRTQKVHERLTLYFINHPNGKDGYRHEQLDRKFAALLTTLKPDIAHIGHLNHLSTGIIDELNMAKVPIVFTLHDFWLMCPRGQFLTRSIGQANNLRLCDKQEDAKCAKDCYQVYFSGREHNEAQDTENWAWWINQRMQETRSILDKVDCFIAPSQYLRKRFIQDFGLPENKILYLDYGFPTSYLVPTQKAESIEPFTFGYIGTHIPSKGVDKLIEAFKQLDAPAVLRIYGRANGASTQALKQLAADCKNKIVFAGEYINHNLADEVFAKVNCIVVPSIWAENSPLVIHEAQACRVPVITANYGGMSEYVAHGVNGLLFEHRSTESLKEQLDFALKNRSLMEKYGQRGYLLSEDGTVPGIEEHCHELTKIYTQQLSTRSIWRLTLDTNPEDCNLHCIMCEEHSPHSDFIAKLYQQTGVKRRRMKFEDIESLFLQAKQLGIREIIPTTMGEPLLYSGIVGMFELAQRHGIKINLTTNGTFPRYPVAEWAKWILPNTTDIKISWNGATAATSERVMQGVNFEQVLANTKELVRLRNEHYQQSGWFCRITFQLTFMQCNMHELADMVRLAAELGVDRVKGHHLWAHFAEIEAQSMKDSPASIALWNEYVEQAQRAQKTFPKPNGELVLLENIHPLPAVPTQTVPHEYECPFLAKELWVSATGTISPCCAPDNLRKSLGAFGNIADTSLQEVLSSAPYLHLVQHYKAHPLCKTCNMRKPLTCN